MLRGSIRALLLLGLAAPGLALAQARPAPRPSDQSAVHDTEARRLAQEEARLTGLRIAAAQRVQEADALHDAALERQRNAARAAEAMEGEARARASAFTALLPVLRRLALYPAETLLALPAAPEEALRGTLVLRSLTRHLREEAAALQIARAAALEATARAEAEAARLTQARDAAQQAAVALDADIAQLHARQAATQAAVREAASREAERAQTIATRAANLPEMIARLPTPPAPRAEPVALPPPPLPPPPLVAGLGGLPVAGRISREFGAPTDAGPARGLTIAAPPGARVVAPCGGRVAFAGVFRSYGQLLILDCGDGLHAVLAGFARLDMATGERAAAGEPLGILGESSGTSGRAALYLELRRNGQITDPRPWLAARS